VGTTRPDRTHSRGTTGRPPPTRHFDDQSSVRRHAVFWYAVSCRSAFGSMGFYVTRHSDEMRTTWGGSVHPTPLIDASTPRVEPFAFGESGSTALSDTGHFGRMRTTMRSLGFPS